jgi:hypothetical protein
MQPPKRESKLIRMVMGDASESEIAEATAAWFAYLQLINKLLTQSERRSADLRTENRYVTLSDNNNLNV